jgi:transposase
VRPWKTAENNWRVYRSFDGTWRELIWEANGVGYALQGREITSFGATTPELIRMAGWLKERHVESVAMERTGIYWIEPHEVLEAQGFASATGRYAATGAGAGSRQEDGSDRLRVVSGCTVAACNGVPSGRRKQCACCAPWCGIRRTLVAESGDWVRRMQKNLDQMNVRVHRAVFDIDGVTGMAILRAIVGGERDAQKLAKLRDRRCSKTEEEIAEQLSGHWREDHLFSLQQALKMYDAVQQRIAAYEKEILRKLGDMERDEHHERTAPPLPNPNKAKTIKHRGQEAKRQALYRMSGVDATHIDAIGVETVEVVLSEYGPHLSRFPTEKQFVSHVTLAPRVPKSGGKPVKKKKRNSASNRVAAALRMAAVAAPQPDRPGSPLSQDGATPQWRYCRLRYPRKLSTLIYRLLRWGQTYYR